MQKQQETISKNEQMRRNLSFGIEEEIFIMIQKIIDKKASQIFKQPVNVLQLPDYYQKIKEPIDISTITNRLKQGKYKLTKEIKEDFDLMIRNCKQYNQDTRILALADKFSKSIETQWTNFQKQLKKGSMDIETVINISQKVVNNFRLLQQKERNKKENKSMYNQLDLTKQQARNILQRAEIKQNIEGKHEDLRNKNKEDKYFQFHPQKYQHMSTQQKEIHFNVQFSLESIKIQYEKTRLEKIQKYKKILCKKISWINQKIIQKCLFNQEYSQFSSLRYLNEFIQRGQIANRLQIKKIQQYVKMVAYWIKAYEQVLSDYMKGKFIKTCEDIAKCIFRAIRFINVDNTDILQKSHQSEQNQQAAKNIFVVEETKSQFGKKYHAKPQENEIKQFKKLIEKDLFLTNKKYLTIHIKCQDGMYSVTNPWANKDKASINIKKRRQPSRCQKEFQDQMERQRIKKAEFQEDLLFIEQYSQKNTIKIIQKYGQFLILDTQTAKLNSYPLLQFKFDNFIL